jgi:regulator of RNase E activity RraA
MRVSETDAILTQLRKYDTCTMSDALDFLGLPGATYGVRPMAPLGTLVGRALTVEAAAREEGVPDQKHLSTEAIASADPGDVMVMALGGRTDVSGWGDIVTHAARKRGVAGAVVDGACRDVDASAALGFPVFARGAVPISARGRLVERANRGPVTFAGVVVNNGDYLIADTCGVVFIPPDRVEEALELAAGIAERETLMIDDVDSGQSVEHVMHDSEFESIVK